MSHVTKVLIPNVEFQFPAAEDLFSISIYNDSFALIQYELLQTDGGSRTLQGWVDYIENWFTTLSDEAADCDLFIDIKRSELPQWRVICPYKAFRIFFNGAFGLIFGKYIGAHLEDATSSTNFDYITDAGEDSGWLDFTGGWWGNSRLVLQGSISEGSDCESGYSSLCIIRSRDGAFPNKGYALNASQINNFAVRYMLKYFDIECRRLSNKKAMWATYFLTNYCGLDCKSVSLFGDNFKIQDTEEWYVEIEDFDGFLDDLKERDLIRFNISLRSFRSDTVDPYDQGA